MRCDIEATRLQAAAEGVTWKGNPDCAIPEQIAVQKLFLHQAAIDSIEVTEAEVTSAVDQQINYWLQLVDNDREKLEEYRKQSITEMRQEMRDDFRNRQLIDKMKEKLVADIKVSPADVRSYFRDLPEDSLPYVPTEVEVQIVTMTPKVAQDEIDRVKGQLRSFTERVTNGETSFATLARLYSEDPGSARQGGELDYTGRGMLDPAFANVAFNLTDPKKISKIVETEFGYHIIQLIDKRGDKVKCRHILKHPQVAQADIDTAMAHLDSIAEDIRREKVSFDEAVLWASDDKDTRNNHGILTNRKEATDERTTRFEMSELSALSPELARVVDGMEVGDISKPFEMVNAKGMKVCAIARLKSRVKAHRAHISEDFQVLRAVVEEKKKNEIISEWIKEKQKSIYVRINEDWRDCEFQYPGWIK